MVAWPVTIPFKILLNGYNEEMEDNRYEFKPDAGRSIVRRKTTARIDMLSGHIMMTYAEFALFETFYTDDLVDGTLDFTAEHPRTGVTRTFHFVSPSKQTPVGVKLSISIELQVVG